MKMYFMRFGSGLTDTWKADESEIDSLAIELLQKYNEKIVTLSTNGKAYKTFLL